MSGKPKCCAFCFGDRGLQKNIIPSISPIRGKCSYCDTDDVDLVEPEQLGDYFGLLINIYEPNNDGKLLVEWLKQDWLIFEGMDFHRSKNLLAEVLNNGEIVRKPFSPSPKYKSDSLLSWGNLRKELMHENRYFPATPFDTERLELLLAHLQADEVPTRWHRARLMTGDRVFSIDEMGAPPKRIASHGRANPAGIPYLYLASTPETAVSEVRPHTGERACVGSFTTPDGLKIVDLRNPRGLVSPFVLKDEDEIGLLRSDIDFLESLGRELTRPIVPLGAPIDYVPSQYLCEFIKKCGYAGVIYNSSVSDGINLALFTPDLATPKTVAEYEITQVRVDVRGIHNTLAEAT